MIVQVGRKTYMCTTLHEVDQHVSLRGGIPISKWFTHLLRQVHLVLRRQGWKRENNHHSFLTVQRHRTKSRRIFVVSSVSQPDKSQSQHNYQLSRTIILLSGTAIGSMMGVNRSRATGHRSDQSCWELPAIVSTMKRFSNVSFVDTDFRVDFKFSSLLVWTNIKPLDLENWWAEKI